MFKLLCVLALCGAVLGQNRNPNPCAGKTTTTEFVNDYASCEAYFWCNLEVAVPSGPCDDTFGFDEALQRCTLAAAICDPCPLTGVLAVSKIKFSS